MNKIYYKLAGVVVIMILVYNAIYIQKLSEMHSQQSHQFDFTAYADSLFHKGILPEDSIIGLGQLLNKYDQNVDSAFARHGNRLGIGQSAYFMVKDSGKVIQKNNEGLTVLSTEGQMVQLETKFLFGNAIRDASKKVSLSDFKNNKEFNELTEALNTLIREQILPAQLGALKVGDVITYKGAIKLSKRSKPEFSIYPIEIVAAGAR
ncbi:DUF2291 family protein [Dyadobacter tibetensis]|uniref:DUF2291 family protein n=1 Tax=Dyadobacter tibetensis TaxID=1211851 RepID=UPI0004702FE9|nr:DUF2291 family protein [Dyadobacter tibetensis]